MYRETLERMREALADWRAEYGDMGEISEEQMVAHMWPGGVQPQTATPIFVPITASHPGLDAAMEGGTFPAPLLVQIHCATQGASLAYTAEPGEDTHWRLYTEPLRLPVGTTVLRARAARIGYKESEERSATFVVEA